jgi:radical SAM protein with 4Fe4S-binding SPASM domain
MANSLLSFLDAPLQLLKRSLRKIEPPQQAESVAVAPAEPREYIDCVIVGTTSLCNASCLHCPTNKPQTEHLTQGEMPARFFESIVDQLAESYRVGRIGFGLYGDPLTDPNIVERVRYAKARLPDTKVNIATNGAAYTPSRHAPLVDLLDQLSLHVESLDPKVYNVAMAPLRLERVRDKLEMILRDFSSKVEVIVPVHKLNLGEREAMTEYFLSRGCRLVDFTQITNRCSVPASIFDQLAFAPEHPRCRSDILGRNLIFDWDGAVFPCCNDFKKELSIGNLAQETVQQTLQSRARTEFGEQLDQGNWAALPTCKSCLWDSRLPHTTATYFNSSGPT